MNKLLFLTSENPFPENSGGKVRDASLLRLLQERFAVQLVFTHASSDLEKIPKNIAHFFVQKETTSFSRRLLSPFRTYVENGYSDNLKEFLKKNYSPGAILWLSRLAMAHYISIGKEIGYTVILDEHNVESDLYFDLLKASPLRLHEFYTAWKLRNIEKASCLSADQVIVTSSVDQRKVLRLSGRDSIVLPNLVDGEKFRLSGKQAPSKEMLFIGTLHYEPNKKGLLWFIDEILPQIEDTLSQNNWTIRIVGSGMPPDLRRRLDNAKISYSENVPSTVPYLQKTGLFFVPLLNGGGTRLKILEALSAGAAVISTLKGAEGIEGIAHGENIWLAEGSLSFAAGVKRLISDDTLRSNLGAKAQELAWEKFDWRSARPVVTQIISSLQ